MELTVQNREKLGKANTDLRKKRLITAVVYGRDFPNKHVSINPKDFLKALSEAGESTIINLVLGTEKWPVLIYDIQKNYLTSEIVHVDFYKVQMDEKIKADVVLEFIGEAPAVKEKLGILNKSFSEIEVEALPGDLPHSLEVDLSSLVDLTVSIHVKDLKLPKGVKVLVDPETVIATVVEVKEEVVAPVVVDVADVKVETDEKKAARDAEKAVGDTKN